MLMKTMPESWPEREAVGSGVHVDEHHPSVRWHGPPTGARAITELETEMIAKGMTRKKSTEHSLGLCWWLFFLFLGIL